MWNLKERMTILIKNSGNRKELTTILKKSKDSIKQLFVPGMYFEDMGITYIGPIDGHNVPLMVDTLNRAKPIDEPILIHVVRRKEKDIVLRSRIQPNFTESVHFP